MPHANRPGAMTLPRLTTNSYFSSVTTFDRRSQAAPLVPHESGRRSESGDSVMPLHRSEKNHRDPYGQSFLAHPRNAQWLSPEKYTFPDSVLESLQPPCLSSPQATSQAGNDPSCCDNWCSRARSEPHHADLEAGSDPLQGSRSLRLRSKSTLFSQHSPFSTPLKREFDCGLLEILYRAVSLPLFSLSNCQAACCILHHLGYGVPAGDSSDTAQ